MAACADMHHVFERPLLKNPTYHEPFSAWTRSSTSFSTNPSTPSSFFDILKNNENWEHNTNNLVGMDVCKKIWDDDMRDHNDIDDSLTMDIRKNVGEIREESTDIAKTPQYHKPDPTPKNHQLFNEEAPGLCSIQYTRLRTRNYRRLPPPISCLGKSGQPWVCLKSIRKDGRLILKGVPIPRKGWLHSSRKNGRLKLQLIYSDDEIAEEEEDEEEDCEGERNEMNRKPVSQ